MAAKQRAPSKNDVEMTRLKMRRDIGMVLAYGGVALVCLLGSALPLWAIRGSVQALAGKKTIVDLSVAVSLTLALSGVINILQLIKGKSRKSEMERMRARMERAEAMAGIEEPV